QPARWLLAALIALVAAALAWLLVGATDTALTVWSRLQQAPQGARIGFLVLLGLLLLLAAWAIWRILHPRPARKPVAERIDRDRLEQRAAALPADDPAARAIRRELAQSDARRASQRLYLALFGDISAGKSALMAALSGTTVESSVIGGTTRAVAHAEVPLEDGLALVLAD